MEFVVDRHKELRFRAQQKQLRLRDNDPQDSPSRIVTVGVYVVIMADLARALTGLSKKT